MKKQNQTFIILILGILLIPLMSVNANAQTINLTEGISYYYSLDETTGEFVDLVDGASSNSATTVNKSYDGVIGSGAFYTLSEATAIPYDTQKHNFSNGLTFSMWIKYPTQGIYGIFDKNDLFASFGEIRTNGGNALFSRFMIPTNTFASSALLNINEWNHITFTYDNSNIKYYINGVQAGTKAFTTPTTNTNNPFTLGYGGDFETNIGIDELIIYRRPLNEDEISTIYNNQFNNTLDAQYPFIMPEPIINETNITTDFYNANLTYEVDLNGLENVTLIIEYTNTETITSINTTPLFIDTNGNYTININGLNHNTNYEYTLFAEYLGLSNIVLNNNFTTDEIIINNDYLIGFDSSGTTKFVKYGLSNNNYLTHEPDNIVYGEVHRHYDINNESLFFLDNRARQNIGGVWGYVFTELDIETFEIREEYLIPNLDIINPSLTIDNENAFIGMGNKIYVLHFNLIGEDYFTTTQGLGNRVDIMKNDVDNIYFNILGQNNIYKFDKDNINMIFNGANTYNTTHTIQDFLITDTEVFAIGNGFYTIFDKDTLEIKISGVTTTTPFYSFESLNYDEINQNYYYSTYETTGACKELNVYEINSLTGVNSTYFNLQTIEGVCVRPFLRGLSVDNDFLYLTGRFDIDFSNKLVIVQRNTKEIIEIKELDYLIDINELTGRIPLIISRPAILGLPPTINLNINNFYAINFNDYFLYQNNITLSLYSQSPSVFPTTNLSGAYNNDYAYFEYNDVTGDFIYNSKLLDFNIVFNATACNEFGCSSDLLEINTFIEPLGLIKSFPDVLLKQNAFKYYFLDNYINEDEQNIISIKLNDELLNQTTTYNYNGSVSYINEFYSVGINKDLGLRTFVYFETYEDDYNANLTLEFTDTEGLKLFEEFEFIITNNTPVILKSVPNPIMKYNDEYVLNLSEYFNNYNVVFLGFNEIDNSEYKFIIPSEDFTTTYADFSYNNDTIIINSKDKDYNDLGIPATIQACNSIGCSETIELEFLIKENDLFDNSFGSLFPNSDELSTNQKLTRVIITLAFLLFLLALIGSQNPETKNYLIPLGVLIILLAITFFVFIGYISFVLILILIFTAVIISVGMVRKLLIGSSGGD